MSFFFVVIRPGASVYLEMLDSEVRTQGNCILIQWRQMLDVTSWLQMTSWCAKLQLDVISAQITGTQQEGNISFNSILDGDFRS